MRLVGWGPGWSRLVRPAPRQAPPTLPAPRSPVARPRVSVVIPTLDEESNIGWVLGRIDESVDEVIIVDGRSRDATVEVARRVRPQVRVLEQPLPGKGAALTLGLCAARGDIVVMMDADGSMDPAEIPVFVASLVGGADLVKGSRGAPGGGSHDMSRVRRYGNRALTVLLNGTYRQRWSELCYGYAALWADLVPLLDLAAVADPARRPSGRSGSVYGHGFEIEALIFCRAARACLRVVEVPSFEHRRRHGASHLRPWRDGWRVLTAVGRERTWRATGVLAIAPETLPPVTVTPPRRSTEHDRSTTGR
jgi:glycosyltransferase involved in cell wall biosynthesis